MVDNISKPITEDSAIIESIIEFLPRNDEQFLIWIFWSVLMAILLGYSTTCFRHKKFSWISLSAIMNFSFAGASLPISVLLFFSPCNPSLLRNVDQLPFYLMLAGIAGLYIGILAVFGPAESTFLSPSSGVSAERRSDAKAVGNSGSPEAMANED